MAGYDFEFYETGKISVTAGQKAFTGSGTAWKLRGCEGALVVVVGAGTVNFVSNLSTDAAGEFRTAWAGPTLANASYVMWLPSAVAATALANHQRLAEIIASIQTAQPASEILAGLAALQPANNQLIYATGPKTFDLSPLSPFARSLLDDGDAATFYATLGEVPNSQIPTRLRSTPPLVTDANSATETGFFRTDLTSVNIPVNQLGQIQVIAYSATATYQRWTSIAGAAVAYERRRTSGTWNAWVLEGLSYTPVNKAGDTITGTMDWTAAPTNWQQRFTTTVSLPASTNYVFSAGSGMILVNDHTSGSVGLFLCGSGNTLLVGGINSVFGTTSGDIRLLYSPDSGGRYYLANFSSVARTLGIAAFRTRLGV